MNLNVIKVEAKTVEKEGQNHNKKYVICTVQDDMSGDVRGVPVFDIEAKVYLDCISKLKGGNADADQPIPEKKAIWKDAFDEVFQFPEPMVRVNKDGQPVLNKFNQMYIRTSCTVLTRYIYDERRALLKDVNGNNYSPFSPMRGWDLATRGTSVMNAFYLPLRNFNGSQDGTNPIRKAAQNNGQNDDDIPV